MFLKIRYGHDLDRRISTVDIVTRIANKYCEHRRLPALKMQPMEQKSVVAHIPW